VTTAFVIAAAVLLITGLFAVIVERTNERDEARTTATRLEAEANAHAAENARLTTELAARGPRLRVVEGGIPSQRTGGHDHLAEDDDWFARLYDEKGNPR
jgi:hypothetical protein